MGGRIKMESIHQVVCICSAQRVVDDLHGVPPFGNTKGRPGRGPDNNNPVGVVGPDQGDHIFSICFYPAPGHTVWLIAQFIENMAFTAIFRRHVRKKFPGIFDVFPRITRIQDMPIQNNVHTPLQGIVHDGVNCCSISSRIGFVAAFIHVHGNPENPGLPVIGQGIERCPGDAVAKAIPLKAMTAHASQLNRLTICIA